MKQRGSLGWRDVRRVTQRAGAYASDRSPAGDSDAIGGASLAESDDAPPGASPAVKVG